jgi:hypothetical protein
VQFKIALLLNGIVFVQAWQTYFPAPDKVTETLPLFVALLDAVTVKVFWSTAVVIVKVPSTAAPVV